MVKNDKSMGERLVEVLTAKKLSQNELAEAVGVTRQVVNRLCNDKVTNSKALTYIADYLDVDLAWLKGESKITRSTSSLDEDIIVLGGKFHKIPVLSTLELSPDLFEAGQLNLNKLHAEHYEIVTDVDPTKTFALISTNNAIKFRFGGHSVLIFRTDLQPRDGDFVIAYLKKKDLFVYRDFKVVHDQKILEPLDKDIYKSINLTNDDRIVAILSEKRVKRDS